MYILDYKQPTTKERRVENNKTFLYFREKCHNIRKSLSYEIEVYSFYKMLM